MTETMLRKLKTRNQNLKSSSSQYVFQSTIKDNSVLLSLKKIKKLILKLALII